jgi:DNA polymerase-1
VYLSNPDGRYYYVDIECDGLKPTQIWVVVVKQITTGIKWRLVGHERILDWFHQCIDSTPDAVFVGHNILSFDIPVLNRILGLRLSLSRCVDTYVLSTLFNPTLEGGHSLESWGERLKFPKYKFDDFYKYSEEMAVYCERDVDLGVAVYLRLLDKFKQLGFSEKSAKIEHEIRLVVNTQEANGFAFDIERAIILYNTLTDKCDKLQQRIYKLFPPRLEEVNRIKYRKKADGSLFKNVSNAIEQYPKSEIKGELLLLYDFVDFNLGSPAQRALRLQELGWEPKSLTPKGAPQVDEESLIEYAEESGIEEVRALADWVVYSSRARMLKTWIGCYNDDTKAIHGRVNTNGAGGGRMSHNTPNTANIPAVRVSKTDKSVILFKDDGRYTYELRDLWVTRNPVLRRLVGKDAKGLELRMLAHHINDPEFTKQVCEGDPHVYNQKLCGLETKAIAKTLLYATMYGAFPKKIGSIVGGGVAEGKELQQTLFNALPGLKNAIDKARAEHRSGRITLIDGRKVLCPSEHAALNYKLQPDGSIVMKQFGINLYKIAKREKLDFLFVGNIHDEIQSDVALTDIKEYCEAIDLAASLLRGQFNLNVDIEMDYKIGLTWAETH